ncbi:MAG: O-antigen ligase family protein [bacterium]|nr:O-antigen ligase family protein [bacterium]
MVLEKILRWIVLAGIFALPFIVFIIANTLFFPFITGKNFAFRIIVEIITGAWLALALVNPEYRPRKSWLLAAFAAFVVIIAAADLNGVNPFKSFWSNYERMDGWVTLAHLFAYFVVTSSILSTRKLWRRFWSTSLIVSVLVGFYGVLQFAGFSALGQGGAASGLGARLDATFGNPIYLAVFMLFNVFIATFLWTESWGERPAGKRLGVSLWYGSVIALDTIILLSTGTRGTILGLIGGMLLAAFLVAMLYRGEAPARRIAISLAVSVLILGAGFWLMRGQAWVHKVGFLDRLATISITEGTVNARIMNWGMAWQGVKERPILGWGQENYAIVFDKYYNPQMYSQEQWFDRVHDIVFDWLVAGGFLGLLSYLSLFVCALWCIWRGSASAHRGEKRQNGKNTQLDSMAFSLVEQSILTGLLAGYFFHNLFVFDNITSYILFTTILAYIVSRFAAARNSPILFPRGHVPQAAMPIVAVLAVVLVWGTAWGVNGRALAQNRALLQAIAPQQNGITENLKYFKEAVGYGSFGTQEAREQLVQVSSQLAGNKDVPNDIKQQFAELAVREMTLQAGSSPLDARFPLFLGVLLDAYGDYTNAAIALKRAHELSPGKQTILFESGVNAQARGNDEEALEFFKEAFDLAPEFSNARIYYAATAIRMNRDTLADEILAPIVPSGGAAVTNISAAYATRGRYDKIVTIWTARVKAIPDDIQARFTLAAALVGAGDSAQAIMQLEELKRTNPSTKTQAEEFLQQIRSGTGEI